MTTTSTSLSYAFNAVLLNPSWSNPYFAVFHAEPYQGNPTGSWVQQQGDSTAGCYGKSYGLEFCFDSPSDSSKSSHTQSDQLITRSMNGGYAASGAGNPHLITASSGGGNLGYGIYYLTVGGRTGVDSNDPDGDGHHYMQLALVDSNTFGSFYSASMAYQAPAKLDGSFNFYGAGFIDHAAHGIGNILVNKSMHNAQNPTDSEWDDAGPIFQRRPPTGSNAYAYDTNSSLGFPNDWIPIRSEWRNIDGRGTNGLIGSMTTDGTSVSNNNWGGNQWFYYTDVDDGNKDPDSSNKPHRYLYRRKIHEYLTGMGEREALIDLGEMNVNATDTNYQTPAPYVIVNYSHAKDVFTVLYYCHDQSNGNDDICLKTSSYADLHDISINFDADNPTYGLHLVDDANIPKQATTNRFVVGQFGVRVDGYGMHVASQPYGGGYDVVVYFNSAAVGTSYYNQATWGHTTYAKKLILP